MLAASTVNTHRHQVTSYNEGLNGGTGLFGFEPEVVAKTLLSADPVGLGRDKDELTERVLV